ncbi:MAG: hypothetical protein PQJ59_10850 [Spirochaetales bacterium]|nr:hypothetical protein [Spirochaetales bacterium]
MAKKSIGIMPLLQILVALLLLTFGIDGITGYNSTGSELMRTVNSTLGGSNNVLPLIFAIIEIAVGALLIAEFFMPVATRFVFIGMIVVCVVWILSIILNFITSHFLEPNFISWLRELSIQLVLLVCFWQVGLSKQ